MAGPAARAARLGLAHFLVDFSCAWLLLGMEHPGAPAVLSLLLYNFCAFALQMPVGLLADRAGRNGVCAALGPLLVCAAIPLAGGSLPLAAVLAGVGNALFHVGGGLEVLGAGAGRCTPLGIFVAPGALGIFLGPLWDDLPGWGMGAALLVCAAMLLLSGGAPRPGRKTGNAPLALPRAGALSALVPLFLVVCLRSYVGGMLRFPWRGEGCWALALTGAVVLGKAAGGVLADALGMRPAAAVSLGLAAALFCFSGSPWAGVGAAFCFNMTMPITLQGACALLPGARGFSFGLLTFGLFLGFLPILLGLPAPPTGPVPLALACLLSLGLLLPGLRKEAGA